MFIPLSIGILILILYFSFMTFMRKRKKNLSKDSLPLEMIEEVKSLIGKAKTGEALTKLGTILEESKSSRLDELLMIKAQLKTIENDRNMNLIDKDDENVAISRINKAILNILNDLS